MKWSGAQECNHQQAANFIVEMVASLPTFQPTVPASTTGDVGRLIFITTLGSDFGLWVGGASGWTRPGAPTGAKTVYRTLVMDSSDAARTPAGSGVPQDFDILTEFGDAILYTSDAIVTVNGQAVVQGSALDFTVTGNVVTYNNDASRVVLAANDEVGFVYQVLVTSGINTYRTLVMDSSDSAHTPAGVGNPNAFDLSALFGHDVLFPNEVVVLVNGLEQRLGVGLDYTTSGNVATHLNTSGRTVIAALDEVGFLYQRAGTGGGQKVYRTAAAQGAPSTTGVADSFDLSALFGHTPVNPAELVLYVNGQARREGAGNDFTVTGNVVTFLNTAGRYTLDTGDEVGFSYEV